MNLKDLQKIETKTTRGERNFELKTALMKIFKALSWLFDGRKDVPEEKIAKTAEIQSKRLGLDDRYNWNEIFSNVGQNEQVKPQHISSSNQVVNKHDTTGDGNCFFHAVFASNSSGEYEAGKAPEMRQEWCKFLGQFKSLDDREMPEALKERLSLIFYDAFPGAESQFNTSALYKIYLNKIRQQDYFIRAEELPILASLANIEIKLFIGNDNPMVFKPNSEMINPGYERNQELWGNKKQETVYLGDSHYSRAEVVMPDKSTPLLDSKLVKQRQEQNDYKFAMKLQAQEYDYIRAQASQEKSDRPLAMKLQGQEYSDNKVQAFQEKSDRLLAEKLQQEENYYELAKQLQKQENSSFVKRPFQECSDRLLAARLQKEEIDHFVKGLVKALQKNNPKENSPNCSLQELSSTPHQQNVQQAIKGH